MVLAKSSSESSSLIGAAVGFAFCLTEGSVAASRGSLEAEETLLGIGRARSGGGPCDGGKVPKAKAGYRNRLRCAEAWPSPWLSSSSNPGVWVKVACLLTDSMYSLAVSDSGGIEAGNGTLGLGFDGTGEVVGGDGTMGAGSTGRGGVSVVSIGTESWSSGVGAGSGTGVEVGSGTGAGAGPGTGVGVSCYGRSASNVLANDLRASVESWVILRVVGVCRFCNNSGGGRSGKSVRSGTFSSGTGLPRKKRFWLSKRILISARMVSILVE